jgi:hypothetical protein
MGPLVVGSRGFGAVSVEKKGARVSASRLGFEPVEW